MRGRIDKSGQPLRFLSIGKFEGRKSYREFSVLKMDFSLERVADPESSHLLGVAEHDDIGRWAQPSVASIADCMRALQQDHVRYASRARENSFVVMEKFSWEAAATKALRVLDERKLLSDDPSLNTYVTPQPYRLHMMEPSQVHQPNVAEHMPRTNLARNAPCFCGSGKKYKHCHGRLA